MKYLRTSLLLLIIILFVGCSTPAKAPITKSGFYFDTIVTITIYDSHDEAILNECFSLCRTFEDKLSKTVTDSDISKINAAGGRPVEVSDLTIEVLKKGIYYSELTDGAFDITIAPLSNLWNFKSSSPSIPQHSALTEALGHVNYKNIVIENNTVTLIDPDASIDLGGIAKGYMADLLKDFLRGKGINKALINLGGNVLTIGNKPDGKPFAVGIQRPFSEHNTPITAVSANDISVVTSGIYERYFKLDHKIYHHILDTTTGYPCENNLYSVTILSDKSVDGDALSTACFVLGLEQGIQLIQSLDSIEAIFITNTYEVIDTRKLD